MSKQISTLSTEITIPDVLKSIVNNGEYVALSIDAMKQVNRSIRNLRDEPEEIEKLASQLIAYEGEDDVCLNASQSERRDRFAGILYRGKVDILQGFVRPSKDVAAEVQFMRECQPERYARTFKSSEDDAIPDVSSPGIVYVQ